MLMSFKKRVSQVIGKSDIVLEILDVRFPELCRNAGLENKILQSGKKLVLVLNKSDLVSKNRAAEIKKSFGGEEKVIFLSSKTKAGAGLLRRTIKEISHGKKVVVGVIGYPNTGKSSVINALRGKHVAGTSIKAGFTKGEQYIKIDRSTILIDTPGVIPFDEWDETKLAIMCAKSAERISDVEGAVFELLSTLAATNPEAVKRTYDIEVSSDVEETLSRIALRKNKLLREGKPDLHNTAKMILLDWQKGKIR